MCSTFPLGGLLPEPISKSYLLCDQLHADKGFTEVTSDTQHCSCSPPLLFERTGFFSKSAGIFTLDYRLCNGTTWSPFISREFSCLGILCCSCLFSFFHSYVFSLLCPQCIVLQCFHCTLNSDKIMWVYAITSYSDSYPFSHHSWFVFSYSYSPWD